MAERIMETPKEAKKRGRPPKHKAEPPVIEGAEADGSTSIIVNDPDEVTIRAPEGLDDFLGRVDRWQSANIDARISAARFPGADKWHSNVFNGFPVTDGAAGVTLSTGETLEI